MPRTLTWATLAGAAAIVVAVVWWTGRGGPVPVKAEPVAMVSAPAGVPALPPLLARTPATSPVVTWTADAQARFEPCGCVAGMFGGLSRRAALLARLPADRLLAFELGGWSGGPAAHQRLRTSYYLQGLARAGIDAMAIGRREITLGHVALAAHLAQARQLGLPVLAANLRGGDGAQVGDELAEIVSGDARFAVTAVVPADTSGEELRAIDPADAVVALLPKLAGRPLIVLADLDEEGLVALARSVPGIALIVGGAVASPTPAALREGSCRIIHAANHGKTVGWWSWGGEACAYELIADTLPEEPGQRSLVRSYQHALAGIPEQAATAMTSLGDARYAGDGACIACHGKAADVHAASRHARAFAALERKGYQHDPDCLRCHVTGLGRPDGYTRTAAAAAPWLAAVSCESCHGPAGAHVAAMTSGAEPKPAAATLPPVSPATCIGCHDAENSPKFAFEVYWMKIRH